MGAAERMLRLLYRLLIDQLLIVVPALPLLDALTSCRLVACLVEYAAHAVCSLECWPVEQGRQTVLHVILGDMGELSTAEQRYKLTADCRVPCCCRLRPLQPRSTAGLHAHRVSCRAMHLCIHPSHQLPPVKPLTLNPKHVVVGEQVRPQTLQCDVFRSAVQYAAVQGLETPTYEVMHTLWVRRLRISSALPLPNSCGLDSMCSRVLAAPCAWPVPVVNPVGSCPHEM